MDTVARASVSMTAAVVVAHEHGERLGVEVVPHQDRRVVTPLGVGGRPSPAERGPIDHVIVDERGGVEQLDHAGQAHGARAPGPGQTRASEQESMGRRRLPPAPAMYSPISWTRATGGVQLAADVVLDRPQIVAHEGGHALFEDLLEGGGGHADGATSGRPGLVPRPGRRRRRLDLGEREFSRSSTTLAVATSSSSSPSFSPVTGCTMGVLSRRMLTTVPGRNPSAAVRSMAMRVVST